MRVALVRGERHLRTDIQFKSVFETGRVELDMGLSGAFRDGGRSRIQRPESGGLARRSIIRPSFRRH